MKNRNPSYKPPGVGRFPGLERGHYVSCPASSQRRTSITEGKLRIRNDDSLTTRFFCLLDHYEGCNMCPNHDFDATFENLGRTEEFDWLTGLMKTACKIADAKVTEVMRRREDCCVNHVNCIVSRYTIRLKEGAVFNKETGVIIHDAIMKAGEESDFNVLHVKMQKRSNTEFRYDIAMVRKGDDGWKPKRRKEDGASGRVARREEDQSEAEEGADTSEQDDGGPAA